MPRFCEIWRAAGLNGVLDEGAGSRGAPGHPYMGKEETDLPRTKVINDALCGLLTGWQR
ncbi:MAG TPA: hypothetical protein VF550_08265 [Polyangia bacterium]